MQSISWDGVERERINENITRRMFWGENIMVTRWELAPGTSLPEHEHVSEQVTMVEKGTVTISFPGDEEITLAAGEMLVIPPSKRHGVKVGPEECLVTDLFSPIRRDFIDKSAKYPAQTDDEKVGEQGSESRLKSDDETYKALQGHLRAVGIKPTLEELKQAPIDLLARFTYERECVSMGQLRKILGIDKKQAKDLLRKWKHGDDHSESSLRKMMKQIVILPGDPPKPGSNE